MKILSFMNVSNQQSLSTDSGFIFYNILADKLSEHDCNFVFAAPCALTNPKHVFIKMPMSMSKYESRFAFDWDGIKDVLQNERPDILLINQIELIANYKAIITTLGLNTKIAGYAHCIPFGFDDEGNYILDESLNNNSMADAVVMSFVSGLQMADAMFVHSKTALKFCELISKKYNIVFDSAKFNIAPPPYDPMFIIDNTKTEWQGFIYNHRISAHYGMEFIAKLANEITNQTNIEFIVTDIMGERSPERNRLDNSVEAYRKIFSQIKNVKITNETCDREKYRQILSNKICSFAPYRQSHTWSMSCIDSLGLGVPVVAPDFGWFKEFFPDDLRYSNTDEALKIVNRLVNDKEYHREKIEQASLMIKDISPDAIAEKFITVFRKLVA